MNGLECTLLLLAIIILAALFCLFLEPRLERWHREREARRWAERVARDAEIISALERIKNAQPGELVLVPEGVWPYQVQQAMFARDSLRAMVQREQQDRQLVSIGGRPTWIPKAPPQRKAALFMPPAELGQH